MYLATGYTDMRKSIDGLAVLVQQGFELDAFPLPILLLHCDLKVVENHAVRIHSSSTADANLP